MSMALKEIKNRIKAANNIKQITKAMKLIASIKLKKIQKTFFPFKSYLAGITEFMAVLVKNSDFRLSVQNLEYFKQRESKKLMSVVISSDKGLCGAFNTNIFNFFEKRYGKTKKDDILLVAVGKKAYNFFSKRNYNIISFFDKVPDIPNFEFSKKISQIILKNYSEDFNISKVEVIYTKFINSMKYEPDVYEFLPLNINLEKEASFNVDHFIFEPSVEKIGEYVFELYLNSVVYKLLIESKLSEFSSRYSAMNTATENADNLIKELKLFFFKKRQESITKELLEISAGVEALK
ncbi:MAG: ATP synthase F1 subunit gamma [bacterium]